MKTACIVQARMGSKRLPGKVLLPLNGHTVLGEVLTRCRSIIGIDEVVCAIPDTAENDVLVPVINAAGVTLSRGSELDVLGRYLDAALTHDAKTIIRITADCPLLSPELCGRVLEVHWQNRADYASNIEPRTFPKGLDCEVFTQELLRRANMATSGEEREHVTSWMRCATDVKRLNVKSPWPMDGRLCLDTEDDYKVICAAFGHEPYQHLHAA